MPSKLAISRNCGRRAGVQTVAFGAAASNRRSKLVVTRRTFPSVLRQRSSRMRCARRSTSAGGRRTSPTARSISGTEKSRSSKPKIRSAAMREPTPEIAPRFCDASTSLLAGLSWSARSLARTARARPKKSGSLAFSRIPPRRRRIALGLRRERSGARRAMKVRRQGIRVWLSNRCVLLTALRGRIAGIRTFV